MQIDGARGMNRMWLILGVSLLLACDSARAAKDALTRASPPPANLALQDGDLVFHRSHSAQSAAVAAATRSKYTHMGVVLVEDDKPMVLEAVQPTKLTPFSAWVARGERGKVVVKRLKNATDIFTPQVRKRMHEMGRAWLGRPYDLLFQWDDDRLYCSELVYKLLDRAAGVQVGKVQKASEFDLSNPEVQKKLKERFGDGKTTFNPDEPVVSPQSMFDDPKLVTVFEN
jgi:hypothetical protein